MDMLMFGVIAVAWAIWAWRVLPQPLGEAHERFRKTGIVRVRGENMAIESCACEWADKATFVLFLPRVHSRASLRLENGEHVQVQATTRWPSMATHCELVVN